MASEVGMTLAWAALLFGPMLFAALAGFVAVYVFGALALSAIARKTRTENAWLAWVPIANLYLVTQIAQVPGWTFLAVFAGWLPFVGGIGSLVFAGTSVWWFWKISERLGRPGWLGVLMLVPVVNLAVLAYLAWAK